MKNGCAVVCFSGGELFHVDYDGNGNLPEDRAKSLAWTLSYNFPGVEYAVLEDNEVLATYESSEPWN